MEINFIQANITDTKLLIVRDFFVDANCLKVLESISNFNKISNFFSLWILSKKEVSERVTVFKKIAEIMEVSHVIPFNRILGITENKFPWTINVSWKFIQLLAHQ